jgi:hypothetical protein
LDRTVTLNSGRNCKISSVFNNCYSLSTFR